MEEIKSKNQKNQKDTSGNKDLEYLKSKKVSTVVEDTGRLYVTNLPYTTTEEELQDLFSKYGDITEVHITKEKETKKSKGMAFILFMIPECAKKALALDKTFFQGRIIKVTPAEAKPQPRALQIDDSSSYKDKLLAKKKSQAGNSINWNTLFMKPDTVVENISKQMGVKKSEILDKDSDNMAVRVALGEAELIKQTREDLEKEGIDFDSKNARSKTMILVKNLPKDTDDKDLSNLFSSYGTLGRIIIPRSKTIALVEFIEQNDAKSAFRGLAYKNFKHVPLYLEWAPVVKQQKKKDEIVKLPEPIEKESNETAVLYVKNINFSTQKEDIESEFSKFGKLRKVTVLKGYAFVEFENLKEAIKAHDGMKNKILDGHQLQIQYSNLEKKQTIETKTEGHKKLIVKNLPFEATKKDLYELFSPFGKIKIVRIPTKVGGGHRGFAFIEFASEKDCETAKLALKDNHLYGRHLILEYSDETTEKDKKRKRDD